MTERLGHIGPSDQMFVVFNRCVSSRYIFPQRIDFITFVSRKAIRQVWLSRNRDGKTDEPVIWTWVRPQVTGFLALGSFQMWSSSSASATPSSDRIRPRTEMPASTTLALRPETKGCHQASG